MCTKIHKLIILNLFSKLKFLGCYNSTPLRWISSPRFTEMVTKEIWVFCLWIFFTSLSNSMFLVNLPLYFAYPDNPTQATCSTNSKILIGTLNNSQVSPITRSPFLFSPYLLDLFLHMFTSQQSLLTRLIGKRIYHQSSKH